MDTSSLSELLVCGTGSVALLVDLLVDGVGFVNVGFLGWGDARFMDGLSRALEDLLVCLGTYNWQEKEEVEWGRSESKRGAVKGK